MHYAISFANPLYINWVQMSPAANGVGGLSWYEDQSTDIYVVRIDNGSLIQMTTDAMFNLITPRPTPMRKVTRGVYSICDPRDWPVLVLGDW